MTPDTAESALARRASAPVPAWTVRHGSWVIGARVLPQIYLVSVSIIAARTLGADGMGRQSFIAFVAVALVTALTAGLPLALMRFVAERAGAHDFDGVRRLVRSIRRIELGAAAIGATLLVAVAAAGYAPPAAWVLAAVVVAATVLHTVPSALLNGLRRWKDATVAGLVTGAGTTLAIVALLASGGGVTSMFAAEAVGAVASLAWTTLLARRALREMPGGEHPVGARPRAALAPEVARFAALASLNVALGFVVWQRSEVLFLAHFANDASVAIYSVAFASMAALRTAFDAVTSIVVPTVAAFKGAGALPDMAAGYRRIVRLVVFGSVPAAVAAFVLGPPLIAAVFGAELAPAGGLVTILAIGFPLVPLGLVAAALLQGLGRQRALLVAALGATAVSIALDLALIPPFGAMGAAWANLLAQGAFSVTVITVAFRAIDGFGLSLRFIGGLLIASVVAGGAAWATMALASGPVALCVAIALFGMLFGAAQYALRVMTREDVAWLQAVLGRCVS